MKIIDVKTLSHGYQNLFVSELRNEIKPISCPDGFERVLLGKNLKVSCLRSIEPYEPKEDFSQGLDLGLNPEKYGYEDLCIVVQQQQDGHILLGWISI